MRIVQVITGSVSIGGAQTHVRDLVVGLTERGHKCIVLVGPPDGLFCEQLRERRIEVQIVPRLQKPVHPFRDLVTLLRLINAFRRLRPDIIAAHTAKAGFLARIAGALLGIPCIFTPHGLSTVDRSTGKTKSFFTILERIGGRLGSGLIAVCRDEQRLALASGIAASEKVFLIHNGIPDCVHKVTTQGDEINLLMIARFQDQKDHSTLFHALNQLSDFNWRLRLAGSGPRLDAMRKLARSLGLEHRIVFLGDYSDTAALLAESAIYVLSTFWEAFPISILEAMRAGVPVIASDVGGIREAIVDGINGLLVPSSRPDLLATALKILFQDRELRKRLAVRARHDYLTFFNCDKMVLRTIDVYQGLLRNKPAPVSGWFPELFVEG
jgi:glycosyltransferase involved in cell wall biosynthesis